MIAYKSLEIANAVLSGLKNNEQLVECSYRSVYSGGMDADGLCGYVIQGPQNKLKVIFYGTNKAPLMVHIYMLVDGKSVIRDKTLDIKNSILFITNKINEFMTKTKTKGKHD